MSGSNFKMKEEKLKIINTFISQNFCESLLGCLQILCQTKLASLLKIKEMKEMN